MSLHPQSPPPAPEETARVARAAFLAGNYLPMRDALDALNRDEPFQARFPVHGIVLRITSSVAPRRRPGRGSPGH
jgi:hypothetical protein